MDVKKISLIEAIAFILIITINRLTLSISQEILISCGSSAILNSIYISLIAILITWIIVNLFKCFSNSDIIDISEFLGGKFLKYLIGIILFIYIIAVSSLILRDFIEVIHIIYYEDANIIYLLAFFAIVSIIANLIGHRALFKTNLIVCIIMVVGLLVAFLSVVPNITIQRIFPILGYGAGNTFVSGLSNIIAFNGLVILYLVPAFMNNHKEFKKASMITVIISAILIILATASSLLAFSFSTSIETLSPLYTLLSNNDFGLYLQHPESLFVFTWFLSFMSYLNISCMILIYIVKKLTNVTNSKPFVIPVVIMVILATLIPKNIISIREIIPYLSKYIGIPIIFVLFPLILILANIKYKHLNKSNSSNIRKEEKNN